MLFLVCIPVYAKTVDSPPDQPVSQFIVIPVDENQHLICLVGQSTVCQYIKYNDYLPCIPTESGIYCAKDE